MYIRIVTSIDRLACDDTTQRVHADLVYLPTVFVLVLIVFFLQLVCKAPAANEFWLCISHGSPCLQAGL